MRNRLPTKIQRAGISLERYMALVWTCRDYRNMARRVQDARITLRASCNSGGGTGGISDPTGNTALRVVDCRESRTIDAIRQAARRTQTETVMMAQIIAHVCDRVPYDRIFPRPYCGQFDFYGKCHDFYIELDRLI